MKMRKALVAYMALLVGLAGLAMMSNPASVQASTIDFGVIAPTAGSIEYLTVGGSLYGKDIQVDNVTGLGTPSYSGTSFDLIGATLNFSSGPLVSYTSGTWSFASGSELSITIVGGVDTDKDGVAEFSGTLMSGQIRSLTVISVDDTLKIAGASFLDVKDPDLLRLFGLEAYVGLSFDGGFNISFDASVASDGTFKSSQVLSGDVVNKVPEPTVILLLGSGLLGLGVLRSRFKSL